MNDWEKQTLRAIEAAEFASVMGFRAFILNRILGDPQVADKITTKGESVSRAQRLSVAAIVIDRAVEYMQQYRPGWAALDDAVMSADERRMRDDFRRCRWDLGIYDADDWGDFTH